MSNFDNMAFSTAGGLAKIAGILIKYQPSFGDHGKCLDCIKEIAKILDEAMHYQREEVRHE